jgi:hypothetical protein
MDVLGHDDVSVNPHTELAARFVEAHEEEVAGACGIELAFAVVATEGEEVGLTGLLETSEPTGHVQIIVKSQNRRCDGWTLCFPG